MFVNPLEAKEKALRPKLEREAEQQHRDTIVKQLVPSPQEMCRHFVETGETPIQRMASEAYRQQNEVEQAPPKNLKQSLINGDELEF